jgi:hypothetical protein
LGTFRTLVEQHFPGIKDENYHSLVFWYHALLAKRIDAGRPLPAPMSVELQRRVVRLYGTWIVKMRYYPSSKFPRTDPEGVYDDVNWIYENRLRMRV